MYEKLGEGSRLCSTSALLGRFIVVHSEAQPLSPVDRILFGTLFLINIDL